MLASLPPSLLTLNVSQCRGLSRGAVLSHSMQTIQPRLMVIGDGCLPALRSACPKPPAGAPWLWAGMGPVP